MNIAMRKPAAQPMTIQQFLEWEERQELRYEFDGFAPVAMHGGTAAHAAIQRNLIAALSNRLRGRACQPFGSHLKVEVAGRIRYPDAFVVCTPVAPRATVVTAPVVMFEILSDSTAGTDLFQKNAEYRATPSVQRYVILQQDAAAIMMFARESGTWPTEVALGMEALLHLPEIGIDLPLADIYAGIEFGPEAEAETVS
jgi:Uma2 family endonuclease